MIHWWSLDLIAAAWRGWGCWISGVPMVFGGCLFVWLFMLLFYSVPLALVVAFMIVVAALNIVTAVAEILIWAFTTTWTAVAAQLAH